MNYLFEVGESVNIALESRDIPCRILARENKKGERFYRLKWGAGYADCLSIVWVSEKVLRKHNGSMVKM